MLSLYPFAPSIISDSIFSSPFDNLIDDDFGWPVSHRRYVLPRRRYVHRHSPYDLDTLIDHMAGLTAAVADDLSPNGDGGKGRRRSPSRNRSRNGSPRRTSNDRQINSAEEKTDVDMISDTKTAEPPAPPSSPAPQSAPDSNNAATATSTADGQSNNAAVANTNTNTVTAPSSSPKSTALSPFRLIKELNGLRLTLTTSDTAYTVTTPLPHSLNKSDLQLSVEDNVLTLSAQIKSAQTNANGKTESSSHVHIRRSIRLDRDANTEGITAHVSEGQLTITIPRTPSEKKQTINIE